MRSDAAARSCRAVRAVVVGIVAVVAIQAAADAARALGLMGPVARDAMPVLRTGLRDPDERVRDAAAEALQLIEPRR